MRPGYLSGIDDYWFGALGSEYFDMIDPYSANPTITIRNQVYGKTAEELPALPSQTGWASLNIPMRSTSSYYTSNDDPYWGSGSSQNWNQLISDNEIRSQVFKLTS